MTSLASHKIHKPSLPTQARRTVESLEHDPIDKNFEGLDIDIIPDVGKGPTLSLSTEEYVIEDDFAHNYEYCHAEKNEESCMSIIEMDEQMHEDFDKDLPPVGIMLPQGAVDNLWTVPGLIFNGRSPMEQTLAFDPFIDLTDAPLWSDLVSFDLNPNSLHHLEEEANQSSSESGSAKPSIKPSIAGYEHEAKQDDGEPRSFAEITPSSISSGEDSLDASADYVPSDYSCTINSQQGTVTKPQRKSVRLLPVTISERRLKQVEKNLKKKENRVGRSNRAVAAGQDDSKPAACSPRPLAQVRRQCIKLSSKNRNYDIRGSARSRARRFPRKGRLTLKSTAGGLPNRLK
ncbi:hypothetical protein Clacol_007263 [Clathrus columnatus]|uniref:Uncharacterized protein n=1 Tax=Clathrus columnatus TaxID=1419009 RepID=A0AAV5AJZ1_9AGAM|nr:hypothetical protein Clacol_007263 [Clathrus columnatus]